MTDTNFKALSKEMAGREGLAGSTILLVIFALITTLLIWANLAELDNVTRGEGRVVSSVQNQIVQAAEGGVILRRHVSENTIISQGDLLFELDPVDASSELNQMVQRMAARDIKEARLRAEIAGSDLAIASEMAQRAPTVALTEQSLFAARKTEVTGLIAVLEQRRQQRMQDLQGAQATVASATRTMDLLQEEIAVVEPLVRDNIAPATRLLELQREFERARGDKERAEVSIAQARSGIAEVGREIQNAQDRYRLTAMEELNAVVAEQSELAKAFPRLQERVSRTAIRAPMDGIVSRLNFRTPGGYVNTGDAILELVPTGEALVIEAKIMPKDISRISPDDQVRIRFSAYDSAKYGTVDGRVLRISPDAVVDEQAGGASYYSIDVAIEGDLLVDDTAVIFLPGMTATVDILSGKRTVFEYIWQPVARVQELALRD